MTSLRNKIADIIVKSVKGSGKPGEVILVEDVAASIIDTVLNEVERLAEESSDSDNSDGYGYINTDKFRVKFKSLKESK